MAARAWIAGLAGLWAVWILFDVFTGTAYSIAAAARDKIIDTVSAAGLKIPAPVNESLHTLDTIYITGIKWIMTAIVIGFTLYVIINSMRRRVDEEYIM